MTSAPSTGRTLAALAVAGLCVLAGCATTGPAPVPAEHQALLTSGEQLEASGQNDAALVQYVKLLGLDPQNLEAHYRIGRVHSTLGNLPTAKEAFQRVLAKDRQHVGALEGLGLVNLESGQRELAAALLHKALARDQQRWRAYNALGVMADLNKKHALAQAYFASALKLRPSDPVLMNNLGYSQYLTGNVPAAQQQFERVVALDPGNQKGWSNLGLVLTRQGQYHRAVESLERIMSPSEARYSVGYICLIDGKLTDAERLIKESIRRSTQYDPAAQAALKRVRDEQKRRARVGDEEETD
jgi:Flp pilus assembly protein TadD